eukprot:TRINITY_DN59276_c0_g2_i1.p1 TRINITY_DN59276_c0_g2~~TRINITY_DN59276_c0_g2_i1.p1  ORF type:complete len:531 (+),score=85.61 TRINITY_DN59276_c0_g2_i1:183-1775(+)
MDFRSMRATFTAALLFLGAAGSVPGVRKGLGLLSRLRRVDLSHLGHPGLGDVTEHWFEQDIDHFSWAATPTGEQTFQQRYFVNKTHWKPGGPIFFYCGNEGNAEMYVNSTGLMWENAKEFSAALVFAEHRYYGESKPFKAAMMKHLHYLTMEQALADYAKLIHFLKSDWQSLHSHVIAFGGSYGGMLASWFRMKYPGTIHGAIAASAPILAFPGQANSFGDGRSYWQVVTRDATAAAGSPANCAGTVRKAWAHLFSLGESSEGRRQLAAVFRLCDKTPVRDSQDVLNLALMQLNAWDTMAMGNFPYPSNYLVFATTSDDPTIELPAFPVRAACERVAAFEAEAERAESPSAATEAMLAGLREAAAVLYNASGREQCFELPSDPNFDGIWDYQYCTELLPQETYFTRDGLQDMFWPMAQNRSAIREHCKATLGVEPRETWIAEEFDSTAGASNIVFSNGLYDPWSSAGVLKNVSESAPAVIIPEGAHHLDLMFSDSRDPDSLRAARKFEVDMIRKWLSNGHQDAFPQSVFV